MTGATAAAARPVQAADANAPGWLVVNADDWGRDPMTTDITLRCVLRGTVSSVSAMVFMEDSERAASLARERGVDAGLHLNFTTAFTARGCHPELVRRQQQLTTCLRRHRLAQVVFHPGLRRAFEYVTSAQIDEFRRLYGSDPYRIDGHHHMHLSTNVLIQRLLPPGALVRRNFSFRPGEKGAWNRGYRAAVDRVIDRRHRTVDFLFALQPVVPERLERIFALARTSVVELETHPVEPDEYRYLAGGQIFRHLGDTQIGTHALAFRRERLTKGGV